MRKILLILILFNGSLALAQQESLFTHYMYNIMGINPAYAGNEGLMTATLLHRSQWALYPGAPNYQTFSFQSALGKKVGAGFSFVNELVGPERNISIKTYYSFTIRTNEKLKISFGLKAGLNMLYIDLLNINLDNPDDPAFRNNFQSTILPSFGVGILAFTEDYYFGVSIPELVQHDYINNQVFYSSNLSLASKKFYLIAGASFPIYDNIVLKPSAFMSVSQDQTQPKDIIVEADISSLFVLDNKFALGIMYHTNNSLGLLAGMMITDNIEFGYSYDMLITNNPDIYNAGGHEIVLKYTFRKNQRRYRGPTACPTFQ